MKTDRHVLLVDDNPAALEFLETRLKASGYRTTVAHSGEAALSQVERDRPAIVLLDLTMPQLNGYQTCRQLKLLYKDLPIIVMTAKLEKADRFWAFQVGADAFMTKPFDPNAVIQRIAQILDKA